MAPDRIWDLMRHNRMLRAPAEQPHHRVPGAGGKSSMPIARRSGARSASPRWTLIGSWEANFRRRDANDLLAMLST
jgi:hypothetical protein